jgi:hypothetical protein
VISKSHGQLFAVIKLNFSSPRKTFSCSLKCGPMNLFAGSNKQNMSISVFSAQLYTTLVQDQQFSSSHFNILFNT